MPSGLRISRLAVMLTCMSIARNRLRVALLFECHDAISSGTNR